MPRTTQVNNLAFHRAVDEAPRSGIGNVNVPEFRALAAIYKRLNADSNGGGVHLTASQAQRRFYFERQRKRRGSLDYESLGSGRERAHFYLPHERWRWRLSFFRRE